MASTFSLKFFIDDNLNVGMKMIWVEEKCEVVLPEHLWPDSHEEIFEVAKMAFPLYALMLEAEEQREVTRKAELERALLKANLAVREVQVPSTDGERLYTLTFHANYISCTCRDWVWRRKAHKGKCIHIRRYLETRQGLETFRRTVPPARTWPNWTLQQLEVAFANKELLERIVRQRRVQDAIVG